MDKFIPPQSPQSKLSTRASFQQQQSTFDALSEFSWRSTVVSESQEYYKTLT